ncbi:MAG TPA: glycolate oxidase subunit GlcE [Rhodocyclaceae bacterium]|nr:glycolate oxidase subunit GlcE [Rhodocyclaceae bacterium]
MQAAIAEGCALQIAGGGSKAFYGCPVSGPRLDATAYRGIVAYEPSELVITARCGTPLAEVEALLAERGQMLAFEPPRFAASATIGGAVAAGLSGPRRMAAGAVRDFVLGVRVLDGRGELLSFGGQVMKNVAGYDVSRLMAGSLGCLGVLAEVSLKVVPRPRCERTLRFELSQVAALEQLHRWAGRPLPISASAWHDGLLHLRLSGATAGVAAAGEQLGGEAIADDAAAVFWDQLRDQRHDFFTRPAVTSEADAAADAHDSALFRLALPDTTPPLALPAPQLIEWGGAQRWCRAERRQLQKIRDIATACGGHATLFRAAAGGSGSAGPAAAVFTPLSPPLLRIHRQLKQTFDPHGVFNRGRLAPEL